MTTKATTKHGCELSVDRGRLFAVLRDRGDMLPRWPFELDEGLESHAWSDCAELRDERSSGVELERVARGLRAAGGDIAHVREHVDALLSDVGRLAAFDTLEELLEELRRDAASAEAEFAAEGGES